MSDSRRRRKTHLSGDSDDLSDSYVDLNATKETQSSDAIEDHHDSEYNTAGSDSETESQDGVLRESGDGQEEEKPQKKLDDDEDRRNPQYIPKRGTFYEHDDRTGEEVTESTAEPQVDRETKEKKVWKDKEDRWNHDRYNDAEQAPKSHEELIAIYGYDIRNEEGPPRARRRRRYGRGPNKYTRNWEDENAYGKVSGSAANKSTGRKSNMSGEEFPALVVNEEDSAKSEEPVISSAWYNNKARSQSKANFPPLQPQQDDRKSEQICLPISQLNENKTSNEETNQVWKKDSKNASYIQNSNGNTGDGDADKLANAKALPRDSNKRSVQESVSLAASRVRGRGFKANANNNVNSNRGMDSKPKGRGPSLINVDNRRTKTAQLDEKYQLVDEVEKLNIGSSTYHPSGRQNKPFRAQSTSQQKSTTVSPRSQQSHPQQQLPAHQGQQPLQQPAPQDASGNRPKRYSSLRQRPAAAEGPSQQNYQGPHGQHTFYPPQGYPQRPFEQTPPVVPPAAPMAGQPVIPLPPAPQTTSFVPPPPFLVPPPQFMPPQTASSSILNYVPGPPNGPTFQPNYQGFQGYNSAPVQPQGPPPPPELFQPQGCTYYSPAQQHQQQQPLRRQKAAIPILPPPDNQQQYQAVRSRGKTSPQQHHQQQQEIQHHQHQLELQYPQQALQKQQYEFQQLQLQQVLEQCQQDVQHQHKVQEVHPHQQEVHQHQQEAYQLYNQQEYHHLQELQQQQQPGMQQRPEKQQQHEQEVAQQQPELHYQPGIQGETIQQNSQEEQQQDLEIQEQQIKLHEQPIQYSVQPEQELQQEQKLSLPELSSPQETEVENNIEPVDDSSHLNVEKSEITLNETIENVKEQTEEVKIKSNVEENLIEITETSSSTPEVDVAVSETPAVDDIVLPGGDVVAEKGATSSAILENPIVEKTTA